MLRFPRVGSIYKHKYITFIIILLLISLLPIWRSGIISNLNFWQFVLQHTIFGPGSAPGTVK